MRRISAIAVWILVAATMTHGATMESVWQFGAGNWNDVGRWSTAPVLPNNTPDTTFDVVIAGGQGGIVTLDSEKTIERLKVGDVFVPADGADYARAGRLHIVSPGILTSRSATLSVTDIDGIFRAGTGPGIVIVNGPNAEWTNAENLTVGRGSYGELSIRNGGEVSSKTVFLGGRQGFIFVDYGFGKLSVSGDGSALTTNQMHVGDNKNRGELWVSDGGKVSADVIFVRDSLMLAGGMVKSPDLSILDGSISGHGTIVGKLSMDGNSTLQTTLSNDLLTNGLHLVVDGVADISGRLDLRAGEKLPAGEHDVLIMSAAQRVGRIRAPRGPYGMGQFIRSITHDETELRVGIFQAQEGDVNGDGVVDFDDFVSLSIGFDQDGDWTNGDFDLSGHVDFDDFTLLSGNFGRSTDSNSAQIPEPDTVAIALTGLCVLPLARRRRRIGG